MDNHERTALKKKLIEYIAKSESEIESFKDMVKPITPENSLGRISRMDAINNKSLAEAALRTKKKKLAQMKIALGKIDDQQFGLCDNCKQPIQQARLIFMPESTKCVRCAAR